MQSNYKILWDSKQMKIAIDRLCYQLIENHGNFQNSCIVGIQHKGVLLANRIHKRIRAIKPELSIPFGKLDITFSRDDFKHSNKLLNAYSTELDFLLEGKRVILIDDVLYTGRTIQAGLLELQNYGRPLMVELLVLIDRRFNRQLPIQADYVGTSVDALDQSYVKVDWFEEDPADRVLFYEAQRTEVK